VARVQSTFLFQSTIGGTVQTTAERFSPRLYSSRRKVSIPYFTTKARQMQGKFSHRRAGGVSPPIAYRYIRGLTPPLAEDHFT
jgi:hypothetical protein